MMHSFWIPHKKQSQCHYNKCLNLLGYDALQYQHKKITHRTGWNSLHSENSIFVLKLMGKIPMLHSVTNHVYWLKWLMSFLILNHWNNNVSLLKGCFSHNDLNNIWSPLESTNHQLTVKYMNIDVCKIIRSYTSMQEMWWPTTVQGNSWSSNGIYSWVI